MSEYLKKNIKYGDNEYLVEFNYTQPRCIGGWATHTFNILEVNGERIPTFTYSFESNKPESIIYNSKMVIRKYLESIVVKPSPVDEFVKWDGDLNNGDE